MQDRSKLAEPVLEQLADAVICADRSGVIVRWNRASIALFWLLVGRGARPESRSDYSWTTKVRIALFLSRYLHPRALYCARFARDCGCLREIARAELFVDSSKMGLDGIFGQEQITSDRLVGAALPQQP